MITHPHLGDNRRNCRSTWYTHGYLPVRQAQRNGYIWNGNECMMNGFLFSTQDLSTNPVHLEYWGFPWPPSPPLESYWPPESSGFRRSSVSGRMHPVTAMKRVWRNGERWKRTLNKARSWWTCAADVVHVTPEARGNYSLWLIGVCCFRTVGLHASRSFTVSNVRMCIPVVTESVFYAAADVESIAHRGTIILGKVDQWHKSIQSTVIESFCSPVWVGAINHDSVIQSSCFHQQRQAKKSKVLERGKHLEQEGMWFRSSCVLILCQVQGARSTQ